MTECIRCGSTKITHLNTVEANGGMAGKIVVKRYLCLDCKNVWVRHETNDEPPLDDNAVDKTEQKRRRRGGKNVAA